jgi:thioredoxin 1
MSSAINEASFSQEVLEWQGAVLVHFWAPWCGLCRMVEPMMSRAVSDSPQPLKIVSINADENLKLSSSYRIRNLPTVLVFKDGELLHRFDRFDRTTDFTTVVQLVLSGLVAAR